VIDREEIESFKINKKSIIITRKINTVRPPFIHYEYNGWCFTHDYILHWLRYQKVKEVVLIGCADFENELHYNTDEKFKPCQLNIDQSINFIENQATKWYKVYKLNPNGKLKVEVKRFKGIIK